MNVTKGAKLDFEHVLRAHRTLRAEGEPFEVRCIFAGRKDAQSAWPVNVEKLRELLEKLDHAEVEAVWWNPQPLVTLNGKPWSGAIRDESVACRRWLFLETDRAGELKKLGPATFAELAAVRRAFDDALAFLAGHGVVPRLTGCSGNGWHAYFRLADWPNDEEHKALVKSFLEMMAAKFNGAAAEVDTAVYNAGRVTKILGTVARKGAPTADRPHRTSGVEGGWPEAAAIFAEQIKKLLEEEPVAQKPKSKLVEPFGEAKIPFGRHDVELTRVAGKLRRDGLEENAIAAVLVEVCEKRCEGYGSDYKQMCAKIAASIAKKPVERDARSLPEIVVRAGEAPLAADQAEEVLLEHARRLGIFQRGGELVKVIRHEEDRAPRKDSKLRIPEGALKLKPLSAPMLMETLERIARFVKWNEKKQEDARIDFPEKVAVKYLSRGVWRLPHLAGVVAAPLLRPDGSLLAEPGYDEATRLFLESRCEWLPLADEPTREDARAALEILRAPFAEFPFVSDEDRAVVIAAILTALERRLLASTPLFAFGAPQPRTGKSHLAEAPALVALGNVPPAFAVSTEGEELRKAFTSILREGHPVINLDNVERPLKSAELCKILTQEKYGDRLLGENTVLSLPTNCMWTATGNNLVFRGDLAQRVLLCRIDAKVRDPEQRRFAIPDIKAHLLEHRAELVHAALTILRAFHIAGRPKQDCAIWGGFEDWSEQIREALVWAGEADSFKTREAAIEADPEMENATNAMRELARAFKDAPFTAAEAANAASEETVEAHRKAQRVDPDLHDALAAVAGEKGKNIDAIRLGYWLRKWTDRHAGDFQLLRTGSKEARWARWKISELH